MKLLLKFLVPIAFAIAAFVGNRMYLQSAKGTRSFVQVTEALKADGKTTFKSAHFREARVLLEDGAELRAVPYSDRTILYGAPVTRDFQANELVFLSDIGGEKQDITLEADESALLVSLADVEIEPGLLKVGRYIGFVIGPEEAGAGAGEVAGNDDTDGPRMEQLGPFRVVSVGVNLQPETASEDAPRVERAATIGVATKLVDGKYLAPAASRLIRASKNEEILAITLYRFGQRLGEAGNLDEAKLQAVDPAPGAAGAALHTGSAPRSIGD